MGNVQLTYDPKTGSWNTNLKIPTEEDLANTVNNVLNTDIPDVTSNTSNVALTSNTTNYNVATGKAEKASNEQVYYTLTATLETIANNQTLKIQAGDTIHLKGFGKYLTGDYYVEEKTIKLSEGGLSVEFKVLKSNFRKTIKEIEKN